MRLEITAELLKRLARVAMGQEPAEIILNNGRVVNVYTGEVLEGRQVLIAGGRIAYEGPPGDFPAGPDTEVIDVAGRVIIPGLIDGHIHMDAWMRVGEFVRLSLPGGTTTVITDTGASATAMGTEGVKAFIRQCRNQPQRFFVMAPTITYLCSYRGNGKKAIDTRGMIELLDLPEVVGLGEIYWTHLINGRSNEELAELVGAAIARGKTVEGHGAGARNQKLAAMTAHGADSCHEPITAGEVRERLRLGLAAMIREGSVRRELETVIGPLAGMNLDLRRAILVSDGVWPSVLMSQGHMDHIVQKAIDLGLDPVQAVRMATLNVAEHFRLDGDLGGIAPGKCADLVVIPDLRTIQAKLVICRGRVVAREGRLTVSPAREDYPAGAYSCVNLPPADPEFFTLKASGPEVRVRAIQMVTNIVNREVFLTLPVIGGEASIEGQDDVVKVAVLERHAGSGRRAMGFLRGSGLRRGAFATSFSFDEGNLVVIGADARDMAAAVNRVRELKGGLVYCRHGRVVEELPMPIFGVVSELSAHEAAAGIESLERVLREEGWAHENPLLTVFTITFTAIPSIRLSARGYWLAKENRVTGLLAGDQ
ncbi:MAG: amidohydrolase family protein [Peptococcaceae bacterium]|nr:amidohydrolase family protein [Peptococcaceae bacterium]